MTPLIFLDTETTGLCPDIHAPWEIAWTTAVHDNNHLFVYDQFQAFVQLSPRHWRNANGFALGVGRYVERHGIDGPAVDQADVIAMLRRDVEAVSSRVPDAPAPHLVGAVPSFDHAMLAVNWLGWPDFGEGLWHYHLIDVEVLVAGKLGIAPPYKSSDLTAAMGVTVDEAKVHTAQGDVDWALRLYAAAYELEVV